MMPFAATLSVSFVLLLLGAPVAICLFAATVLFLVADPQVPLLVVIQRAFGAIDSFPLMAVPFFVLVGQVMNQGGITDRIFAFCNTVVGHVRGGLAHVNILASVLMSGMSGSAVADAAGLGQVEIRAMTQQGYDRPFSAAVTAASATIGPIIPPSIPLVIYGSMAGVSVSQLLLAGILPGLLMAVALILVAYVIAWRRGYPVSVRSPFAAIWKSFLSAFPALLTPVILVGGILSGVFTPTESAAVAALYAIFVTMFVYRALDFAGLVRTFIQSSIIIGTIFFIIAGAAVLGWLFMWLNIPRELGAYLSGNFASTWQLLLVINLFLLVIGCFLEANAALILVTPLLYPIIVEAGIDPVQFGIILAMNLMLGLITPPIGLNMYIVSKIAEISIPQFVRAVAPFGAILVIVLGVITYWPPITLYVPRLFFE
jgi:tripartite ATP-independent transporter DctM subunit